MPWTFYTAFLGTVGSILGHGYIAITEHDHQNPKSLSELAAAEQHLLTRFRWTALTCSTLLGITVYGFIAQRNTYGLWQSLAWSLEYISGILMVIVPAKDKNMAIHNVCAQVMALGMLALAYLFLPALTGSYFLIGLLSVLSMTVFGVATVLDRRHFIIYEIAFIFIFISHITICIAALSLK